MRSASRTETARTPTPLGPVAGLRTSERRRLVTVERAGLGTGRGLVVTGGGKWPGGGEACRAERDERRGNRDRSDPLYPIPPHSRFVVRESLIPSVGGKLLCGLPAAAGRRMIVMFACRRICPPACDIGVRGVFAIPFMELSSPPAKAELALDARSFDPFYEDALPRIYGYFVHRCGGSVATAEDLTQETFLAAVAELKREKRVVTPKAWIYGIARHKLLDYYRRLERQDRPLTLTADVEEPESETVVEDEQRERDGAVAALSTVAASQRAALVLCYVDGYSVPEAAQLLGKSVEAVESLLARGRQSFKRAYREEVQ